ncbi:MAG: septum formation initiator family protein [Desulfovibrio sp.]|nr:septum formation initiator family protein [Desulfovibrio sp.]
MILRTGLIIVLGLFNIALLFKTVWGPTGLTRYQDLKRQYQDLQDELVRLDKENVALSRDIRLMQSDSDFAEKTVRQKLHYMRDNEIVYLFTDSSSRGTGVNANDGKN